MNDLSNRLPESFESSANDGNQLSQYIQSLNPDTIAQLSSPNPEVAQIMERNLAGMLGILPGEHFNVTITTNRENLGRLLASAMMSGYFLNNAQQRMILEKSLQQVHD